LETKRRRYQIILGRYVDRYVILQKVVLMKMVNSQDIKTGLINPGYKLLIGNEKVTSDYDYLLIHY
jgi:hypothetical protein